MVPFRTIAHADPEDDLVHPQVLVWGLGVNPGPVQFMESVFRKVIDCGCKPLGKYAFDWIPMLDDSFPHLFAASLATSPLVSCIDTQSVNPSRASVMWLPAVKNPARSSELHHCGELL